MIESEGSAHDQPAAGPGPRAVFDESTEFGRDLAAVDWAASAVGPWQQWPASLTNTVRLMMGSRFAMWMAWGEQLTFFCNDDYRRDTLGAKYPWALGKPAPAVWSEIWGDIGWRVEAVISTGVATWDEGLLLFLERSGYPEETYHTFSYSPIHDDDGRIAGLLCVVSEDTARVISERRIALLSRFGAALSSAVTEAEVAAAAHTSIASDPYDVPFAIAYTFDDTTAARLHWAAGVAPGSAAAPLVVTAADDELPWHSGLFGGDDAPHRLLELGGIEHVPTGAWQQPPRQAVALPLVQTGSQPYGYLMIGLNPFRELDDDYRAFVDLIAGQLSASIARARAFEAERDRVERLAELDRAKTTFFTNVSHELRTPLTLLLGPADDALSDREHLLAPAQRERVEIVQRNGERLLKLVNTLLDFSRLESGRVQATFEQLDLRRFTIELATMFESAYARSGLRLELDCAPLTAQPFVDREMWSKIVLNLLSNALKATFTGGATVHLHDQPDAGGVRLTVADTGVGIPAHELGRLFERFHRVAGAELRTHEGSGIGLALVAELAALHGGTVTVASELGVGSRFSVTIPYGRAHLPDDQVLDGVRADVPDAARYGVGYLSEALRWLSPAQVVDRESSADLPRVLVVDDNTDMRDYVANLLRSDYVVETASDGGAALQQIRSAPPDLVLTDVMMPVLDGFGLLAALRADPATMHIPVVMLSARSGDDATVEGLEAGADDYLVKPFSARELLARVRANLELDRVRRVLAELQRSQQMLHNAESLAHIGSWELELATRTVRLSAEMAQIMGLRPDRLDIEITTALAMLPAGERTDFADALELAASAGTALELEVHPVAADHTVRTVRINAVAVPGRRRHRDLHPGQRPGRHRATRGRGGGRRRARDA